MSDLIKVDDSSQLPAELADELQEQSRENLEGVQPRLPKIQMPTGSGKVFNLEVMGAEDERQEPEILGIVLYQTASKAYWSEPFGGGGSAVVPDCASHDGVTPSDQYTDKQAIKCALCQHNRFGTATSADGTKSRGKACRDVKRVVVLLNDDQEIPYLLTVPPTSLRNFDDFMIKLRKEKRPYWTVMTKLTLATEISHAGIKFPKIVPAIAGYINDVNALKQIKEWKEQWLDLLQSTMFSSTDVAVEKEPDYVPAEDFTSEPDTSPEY